MALYTNTQLDIRSLLYETSKTANIIYIINKQNLCSRDVDEKINVFSARILVCFSKQSFTCTEYCTAAHFRMTRSSLCKQSSLSSSNSQWRPHRVSANCIPLNYEVFIFRVCMTPLLKPITPSVLACGWWVGACGRRVRTWRISIVQTLLSNAMV